MADFFVEYLFFYYEKNKSKNRLMTVFKSAVIFGKGGKVFL